jgi:acyl-CoA thioesterase-2
VQVFPDDGSDFTERLTLERIDRDIFTGWCHAGAPLRAFGGQVAAQALVAAGTTVDSPDRHVHSLHAYFIRPGRTTDAIVYLVDRLRDGRSFTTRRVRAVQYGETIFALSASFALDEPGPEHQLAMPAVPEPESLPPMPIAAAPDDPRPQDEGFPYHRLLDVRLVDPDTVAAVSGGRSHRMAWLRTHRPLPDDSLTQVCTLTYASDLTLAGTTLVPHPEIDPAAEVDIASVDHAMWFHGRFRADEWLLFVQDSPVARGGHGLARGEFFRRDGLLVASAVQEVLLRRR